MRIATFNVNGINGRLPVLLRWLADALPDVVCLQELKAASERFPEAAIREAGYGAIWHGQKSWNGLAILARGAEPIETCRGLPGDFDDTHSRYIEAAVNGVLIGCLYLPNGNPAPGPKLDYKLRWFERLAAHAAELLTTGAQVVLAGDYNVMPTELDVYKPERWLDDALFRPEVRAAFHQLVAQGWTDAPRDFTRTSASTPSGTISGTPGPATLACASTICCSAPRLRAGSPMPAWTVKCEAGRRRAITLPPGLSFPTVAGHSPHFGGSVVRRRPDMVDEDAFDLERFVTAQAPVFTAALAELQAGRKRSHWMWFVFPQMRGLGHSTMAQHYGIGSLDEARAYLKHSLLGSRLTSAPGPCWRSKDGPSTRSSAHRTT